MNKKHAVVLIGLLFNISLFFSSNVFADTKSGCFVTKVGNPSGEPPNCPGTSTSSTTTSGATGGGTFKGFVYYCQGNTQWKNTHSLGNSGCGPTSTAMVLSSFGTTITPPEVASKLESLGFYSSAGSIMNGGVLSSQWLKGLGFSVGPALVAGGSLDLTEAKKFIDQGNLIIASSTHFPCGAGCPGSFIDHVFVVDSIDIQNQKVEVRDPSNCSYTDGNDESAKYMMRGAHDFSWYYAFPIKK